MFRSRPCSGNGAGSRSSSASRCAVRPIGPAGLAVAALRRQRADQVEVGRLVVGVDVEDAQPQPDGFAVVARFVGEPPELAGGLDERVAGQLTRARPPSRRTGRRRRSRRGSAPRPGPARPRPFLGVAVGQRGAGPSAASRRNCSTSTSTCSRTSHTVSWSAATYWSGGNDFCGSRTPRIVLSRTDSRRAERSDSSGHSRVATSSRTTGAPRRATSSLTKSRALREPHSLISTGTPFRGDAEAAERRDGDRRRTGRRRPPSPGGPRRGSPTHRRRGAAPRRRASSSVPAPARSTVSATAQGGAGLADRVAELAPQPPRLLGQVARRRLVDRRLEEQRLGDRRAVAMRVRQRQRRLGPARPRPPGPRCAAPPSPPASSACGCDTAWSASIARSAKARARAGSSASEHPGRADQRRDEALHVASPLGPGDRLGVQRQRLRALTAEELHVAELAGRVVDELGADALPDVLGPPEVTAGVVESAHAQVRVAAVEVGEAAERLRADQLGGLDGVRQLLERLVVRALLGVVAAAVGEDPHHLDDVAGPLARGRAPRGTTGRCRAGRRAGRRASPGSCARWRARRRRRSARRPRGPDRAGAWQPSTSPRTQRIAACHARTCASSAGSVPSRRAARHAASPSSSRPRR